VGVAWIPSGKIECDNQGKRIAEFYSPLPKREQIPFISAQTLKI
jgi:hypothetical protein